MPHDTGFADVLRAAAAGEHWACRAIWERFSPGVAGYVRLHGSVDPDDTTSEVFLAVFQALPRFHGGEAGFRALVYTIARRRLVDEHRRRSARPDEVEWDPGSDPRLEQSAEDLALAGVGTAEVIALLRELAPDQREVLMLRLLGDLTVAQVAAVMERQPGAVKALQRRGLAALRRHLVPPDELVEAPVDGGRA